MDVKNKIRDIVIIGAGNVAFHLVHAFSGKGVNIVQVLAGNQNKAGNRSRLKKIPFIYSAEQLDKNADLYILAVQDDRIRDVALSLKLDKHLLVHTSGFSDMKILEGCSEHIGVIWPLQTMTKGKELNYSKIPFFIEGNSPSALHLLNDFISLISQKISVADSSTRRQIHLAAVIAANLTNHLYAIAETILKKQGIPFHVLAPLILETARKAGQQSPSLSQTGPAVRNDLEVIKKHLQLLEGDPESKEIYRLISENIINKHSGYEEEL